MSKTCTKCDLEKPLNDFSRQASSPDGYRWRCKSCDAEDARARRADPEFIRRKRENSFRFSYGITIAKYDAMHDAQNGLCRICKKPETKTHSRTGKILPLSVDHCHNSSRVRGLLCSQCNLMIGLAEDNIEKLQSAIDYLRVGGEDEQVCE